MSEDQISSEALIRDAILQHNAANKTHKFVEQAWEGYNCAGRHCGLAEVKVMYEDMMNMAAKLSLRMQHSADVTVVKQLAVGRRRCMDAARRLSDLIAEKEENARERSCHSLRCSYCSSHTSLSEANEGATAAGAARATAEPGPAEKTLTGNYSACSGSFSIVGDSKTFSNLVVPPLTDGEQSSDERPSNPVSVSEDIPRASEASVPHSCWAPVASPVTTSASPPTSTAPPLLLVDETTPLLPLSQPCTPQSLAQENSFGRKVCSSAVLIRLILVLQVFCLALLLYFLFQKV